MHRARRVLRTHFRLAQARQALIVFATLVIAGSMEERAPIVHLANIKVKLEVPRARRVLTIHM